MLCMWVNIIFLFALDILMRSDVEFTTLWFTAANGQVFHRCRFFFTRVISLAEWRVNTYIHIIPEVIWLLMSSLMQMKGMINDVLECVTVIILQSFFLFCSFFFFPPNFIFVVVNKRVTTWKMRLLKI